VSRSLPALRREPFESAFMEVTDRWPAQDDDRYFVAQTRMVVMATI
jgi:hypothetical protein